MRRYGQQRQLSSGRAIGDNRTASETAAVLAGILVVVGLAVVMLHVVSTRAADQGQNEPGVIYMLVDVSASDDAQHRVLISKLIYAAADRMPAGTRVRVLEFSDRLDMCYDGYPENAASLVQVVERFRVNYQAGRGTFPDLALEDVLRDLNSTSGNLSCAGIIVLTDGEDQAPARTEAAVRQLVLLHKVKAVWIAPTKTRFRLRVEQTYGALGDRFTSSGVCGDAAAGCERFFTALEPGS